MIFLDGEPRKGPAASPHDPVRPRGIVATSAMSDRSISGNANGPPREFAWRPVQS
jgi:hypothetical protein